jgi:hypothetical protein
VLRCGDKRAVAASDLGQQAAQAASKAGVPPGPEQETTFSLRVAYGGAQIFPQKRATFVPAMEPL